MQKVLLAIDGITPSNKALHYAVELCKRIKADLNVLQIINPQNYIKYIQKLGKRVNQARKYMEDTLVVATFAEAGEHEMAMTLKEQTLKNMDQLLTESERDAVHYHLSLKAGPSDKEIVNYVNEHRDIILTIYDVQEGETDDEKVERKTGAVPMRISRQLSTPLVVVKG
jgi:nucleotide-binding universal stress UspA family protein